MHLTWKVFQKGAATAAEETVPFPLSWKIFLNFFHLETHSSFTHGTEPPQPYMLLVMNLHTPQLHQSALLALTELGSASKCASKAHRSLRGGGGTTPGAAFVTSHAATEHAGGGKRSPPASKAQHRAPRGTCGTSNTALPGGRGRSSSPGPPHSAPPHMPPGPAPPAASARPTPVCDRAAPLPSRLGPEMPLFSVPKEVAVGTAMLGVAFATGMLAGKRYPLIFGTPKSPRSIIGKSSPIRQYILDHSLREHPILKKLRLLTADHPWGRMMVSCDQAQFMANLVKLIKAKKVIEIGVFTGYNALNMALVLPDNGRVVACDINEDYVKIGKPLWKEAGVEHKIDLRIKPAIQTLDELLASGEAETFDFAFIDADKESYNEYYEKCLRLIKKGGIIAIDNVLWNGKVLNPRKDDLAAQSIHHLNEKLLRDARVSISMIPMGDGVTLAFKL
uniref:Catechol-O-methyltransferase domain containing 1 n=2 Tax=Melopsittacus undulatus TaxID=13146 RepID=A0A8V5G6D9_MELUD